MKRRRFLFLGIFVLFLGLLYMQPVWFPRSNAVPSSDNVGHKDPPATTLNYVPIKTQGMAEWIGKNLTDFQETFGVADEKVASGFSFTIERYYLAEDSYMEVNVENESITAIKFMGEDASMIQPFDFGMTMNDLAQLTMVYPNFKIDYSKNSVGIELTEDDMNYRPLLAFDNDSFAILFFDLQQGESSLYSVMYLDKATLLKLSPYQVTEGESPHFVADKTNDWQKTDYKKQQQSVQILQSLRTRDGSTPFHLLTGLQQVSEDVLKNIDSEPENILTTERLQALQRSQAGLARSFRLTNGELKDALQEVSQEKIEGFFETPIYDPMFSILSWRSDPYLQAWFSNNKVQTLGVAYSKENVLVLMQETQQTENSTEESDN